MTIGLIAAALIAATISVSAAGLTYTTPDGWKIVQTANGPYFLKLTGPQATVAKWDKAFNDFVASIRYVP